MSATDSTVAGLRAQSTHLERRIGNASNKDEALGLALEAAELCMKALKIATRTERPEIRTQVQTLLDEAERIKRVNDWQPLIDLSSGSGSDRGLNDSKAPSIPQSIDSIALPDFSQLEITESAASEELTTVDGVVSREITAAQEVSTESSVTHSAPQSLLQVPTSVLRLQEPVSSREFSRPELIILLRGSKLNHFQFPPWKAPPKPEDFVLRESGESFREPSELCLSRHQLASFDGWKRAKDAIPPPSWFPGPRTNIGPTMQPTRSVDLVQDAATDCSVVASLCASAARAEKGHDFILSEVLYPWDHANQRPMISPNGKYVLRLNFNGCYRKIEIDDRLPVSKTQRLLHIIDRKNPALLWPALLEKAYLKVRGGYDFPGSNSSTDLWILTGWIPEQIFLQDDTTEPYNVWKRMLKAFQYGDLLVTMGTGKMNHRLERELGLAGQHDYAVLDMKAKGEQKLVLLKNPWCEGTSWKGTLPLSSTAVVKDNLVQGVQSLRSTNLSSARQSSPPGEDNNPGTFWIDWNNVLQHFESIYLNWNPGLFSHREDIHFAWDLTKKRSAVGSFVENPQFAVSCAEGGSLWLLLCRHFKDTAEQSGDILLDINVGPLGEFIGHISLYVYDRKGQRIHISATPVERGPYVDSPQTLLRLEIPINATYTVVVSEQDLPPINHTFSLMAFSHNPVQLTHAHGRYPFTSSLESAWTASTAGGGAQIASYSSNPQFSLEIPNKTPIALLLETPNSEFNVHVKVVHGGGKRIINLSQKDILIESGEYRRGSAFAEVQEVDAGIYTIVCSTFESGQRAGFSLRVDSFVQTQLKQLPAEHAGRMPRPITNCCFNWGNNKQAAPLYPRRLLKLSVIAKYRGGNVVHYNGDLDPSNPAYRTRSPIRITIEHGRGPARRILAVSSDGDFLDAEGGLRTPELDLWPEMAPSRDIFLVIERLASPAMPGEERFGVELWCDHKLDDVMVLGVWRSWDD